MKKIVPTILTKNPQELREKLNKLVGLVDLVQVDFMDGQFVDSASVSVSDLIGLDLGFDLEAHLMVNNPEAYLEECRKANIKRVVFHLEAVSDVDALLNKMDEYNFEKVIAINPETPVGDLKDYLSRIDGVMILSVHPGAGGQQFIVESLNKINELRELSSSLIIEVDGGVKLDNIDSINEAGANYFVIGSAIWENRDIEETIKNFQAKIS